MSSIIVLDSSDEDESPPKKAHVNKSAGINPTSKNQSSSASSQNAKPRAIPSGITITPRLSPTSALGPKNLNMPTMNTPASMAASYFSSIMSNERQTPTPPKGGSGGGLNQRKRKTPTPPQAMARLSAKNYASMTTSSPAKAATTVAPLPPIMPTIASVHSMANAGNTPPLQLMATPPSHNLGAFMGLNEQLMINPHLFSTGLPANTTITAHPNPNQNNINNNFKIHLPFNKPNSTPSPAASPASSAPKTPSPQLTPSPQHISKGENKARRIKPTTLLKSTDENWQRHKQFNTQNDKQSQRTPISLNNDVVIEMLPPTTESPKSGSASSSRHHTPMTSPSTPKSQKSPDVIMLTTPNSNERFSSGMTGKDYDTVLDLTHSPDKDKSLKPTEFVDLVNTPPEHHKKQVNGDEGGANDKKAAKKPDKPPPKPPLEPEYEELIKACREADRSKDMEKLIKSKLLKYYYEVHGDFVKSKSFRKSIRKVVAAIKDKPDLVYFHLKTIVEELKVRRKARKVEEEASATTAIASADNASVEASTSTQIPAPAESSAQNANKNSKSNETTIPAATSSSTSSKSSADISATVTPSTGNKKLDEQIKKLNKALYVLTKRIEVLEQSEVDWDDDDSSFLQVERFKKRACQIYEKICDLTGESKNAHRLVKKPIKFNETRIPQFNKTLQAFINRTKEFPDYFDVLRMLEHCNRTYSLGLVNFEMKNIAEDAFIKVGKLLQSRRKADLYETVMHHAGDGKDPAKSDPLLAAKLNENLKNHKKISEILEKFARKQDMPEEEEEDKSEKTPDSTQDGGSKTDENETVGKTKEENANVKTEFQQQENDDEVPVLLKSDETKTENAKEPENKKVIEDEEEEDDEEDDEEEEDEDEENLDEQVETLANGDVTDNESDNELDTNKENVCNQKDSDKQNDHNVQISSNNENAGNKNLEEKSTKDLLKPLEECIEITDNSQEILRATDDNTIINCNSTESSAAEILPDNDVLLLNNNNNNNLDINTTNKTVTSENTTKDSVLPMSPCSALEIPKASINPIRNGKLKDTTPSPTQHLLNNLNDTNSQCSSPTTPVTTSTTTTKADLQILHVSSLDPHDSSVASDKHDMGDVSVDLTSTPTNKTLEEIVISDEES